MQPSLRSLILQIATLPSADRIVVFGSAAAGKENPRDLDVCLLADDYPDWKSAVSAHRETIQRLRELAFQNYGALDPFVLTSSVLVVRNDEATGWQRAKNSPGIARAIKEKSIPVKELIAKLELGLSNTDKSRFCRL